jgi:hypothetical protein
VKEKLCQIKKKKEKDRLREMDPQKQRLYKRVVTQSEYKKQKKGEFV